MLQVRISRPAVPDRPRRAGPRTVLAAAAALLASGAAGRARAEPAAMVAPATRQPLARPMAESPTSRHDSEQGAASVPFTRVYRSATSAYPEPVELALTADSSWRSAWALLWPNQPDGSRPAPPAVDFTRDAVVFVALGPRSSGGYDVRVDSVTRDAAGALLVRYTATSPGPGCLTTQQITSPVEVVRVPRPAAGAAVRVAARRVASRC